MHAFRSLVLAGAGALFVWLLWSIRNQRRSVEALREVQAKMDLATDAAELGLWERDLRSDRIWASAKTRALYGLPAEGEVSLEQFLHTLHPDDRERTVASSPQGLSRAGEYANEYRVIRADGGRWLAVRSKVLEGPDGKPQRVVGASLDITERKRAEAELELNRRRLQAIFDGTLDAIVLLDDRGRYVDANPAACKLLGFTRAEMLEKAVVDLVAPNMREGTTEVWKTFLAAGRLGGTYVMQDAGGKDLEVEYRAVAHILPGLHLAVLRDMTERRRAQAEVRGRDELIQALFKSLYGNVAVLDRNGIIVAVNEGWERFAVDNDADPASVDVGADYLDACRRSMEAGDASAGPILAGIQSVLSGALPEFSTRYRCDSPTQQRTFEMVARPLRWPEGGAVIVHLNLAPESVPSA